MKRPSSASFLSTCRTFFWKRRVPNKLSSMTHIGFLRENFLSKLIFLVNILRLQTMSLPDIEQIFSSLKISPEHREKFSVDPRVKGQPCSFSGCSVQKITKCNCVEGQPYCATHFKSIAAKLKKEASERCKHVVLIGEKNAGDQCASKAVANGFCNRHQKRTANSRAVIGAQVVLPDSHCLPEEIKFWNSTRRVILDGSHYDLHKSTGLCISRNPTFAVIGAILKDTEESKARFVKLSELSKEVQNWCETSKVQ